MRRIEQHSGRDIGRRPDRSTSEQWGYPRSISIFFLLVAASLVLSQSIAGQIDSAAIYRLTNGYGKALSVSGANGTIVMAPISDSTDQLWKIVSMGGGKYRIVNSTAGDGKSLDNRKSGDQYSVVMGTTGNYSGQFWTLTQTGPGKYRLSNDYAGADVSLDSATMAATGNTSGQAWTLTKATPEEVAPVRPLSMPTRQVVAPVNPVPNITDPARLIIPTQTGAGIDVTPPSPSGTKPNAGPEISYDNVIMAWDPRKIPTGGKLICAADLRASGNCGFTKADHVGDHKVNLKCEKGFYDPIWGGTCWDFPKDDGNGTWVRGTTAVTADDAIWRTPKESFAHAKKERTGAAWDCKEGEFWDGWSGSGSGGAGCYTCPTDHPRRTANPVYSGQACASAANETGKAVFLSYNGCPKPVPYDMGLKGKRMPGKPFLDIGAGGCYACPNADEDGTILVTDRNGNPVTSDNGCTVKLRWKSPEFPEPGMAGLTGVKEVLLENMVFDNPDILTDFLTRSLGEMGRPANAPGTWSAVGHQWEELADHPYQSPAVKNLMLGFLEVAAQTDPSARTPAQKKLVASMEEYMRLRRTFIAEQTLAMYDAWKAEIDKKAERRAQSETEVLFDYGTVPLDFHSAALAGFGLSAAGISTATGAVLFNRDAVYTAKLATEAYNKYRLVPRTGQTGEKILQVARANYDAVKTARGMGKALEGLKAFRALATITQLGTAGPAVLIEVAGIILQSIAIDQFIAIQEARPKLEEAVETAKEPVDLQAFLAEPDGKDQLTYFWAKAIDVKTSPEDPQLVAKAHAAMELARQTNFRVVEQP